MDSQELANILKVWAISHDHIGLFNLLEDKVSIRAYLLALEQHTKNEIESDSKKVEEIKADPLMRDKLGSDWEEMWQNKLDKAHKRLVYIGEMLKRVKG